MTAIFETYSSTLMQRSLIEAVLVGILCGVVGVHVFVRRLSFFAHTVAHASFPGIVLALIAGVSALWGSLAFTALLIVAIWLSGFDTRFTNSTVVGVALTGSFALGVVLQSSQQNFRRDLSSILVGQIAAVQPHEIAVTAAIGFIILSVLAVFHKELVLSAFDPTEAAVQGRGRALDLGALLIVGATVALAVPAVGTILAAALLVVPAMTARLLTERIETAMAAGALLGALAGAAGLTASAEWDLAAGASITLASAALFALAVAFRALRGRARRRAAPA